MKRQKVRKALILVSFLLFPVTLYYFSPYLVIMGAFEGVATGSLIVFGSLFIFSLLLGRAFCGWICPAGGLQEACLSVTANRVKGGRGGWIKYFLWAPWLGVIIIASLTAGGLRSAHFFYQTESGISITHPYSYILYYLVVGLIMVLAITAGRRAFCHYGCWMAPFMIVGVKISKVLRWPSLCLRADPAKCKQCRRCSEGCPMSLPVEEMARAGKIDHAECILCGSCVDICPEKSIRFSFGIPEKRKTGHPVKDLALKSKQ